MFLLYGCCTELSLPAYRREIFFLGMKDQRFHIYCTRSQNKVRIKLYLGMIIEQKETFVVHVKMIFDLF